MAARITLITGVTRGLGRAMADQLIGLGHTIIGCGRSAEGIEILKKEYPNPHDVAVVDVSDDVAVRKWAERVIKEVGVPELLLNNAALINRSVSLWEVPADEFSRVIDVNIKGVASVIRHFLPAMIQKRQGVIVNFSSGWGRSTSPEVAPYCATKYAIEGLTLALAQELPEGLAAIPLSPGIIDTDMLRSCMGDSASSYPDANQWAERAVPYILKLGPKDNGKSLSV